MGKKLLMPSDEILVQTLAKQDAIFTPQRRWIDRVAQNTFAAREAYKTSGIPWASEATTATTRSQAMRTMLYLADCGLIDTVRAAGRTMGITLTLAGEVRAQSLASMPTIADRLGWVLVDAIAAEMPTWADGLVDEDDLVQTWRSYLQDETATRKAAVIAIEACLLPFLARGWAATRSTITKGVRYTLTASYEAEPDLPAEIEVPEFSEAMRRAARQVYVASFNRRWDALANDPVLGTDIGEIPVAVSRAPIGGRR